MTRHLEWKRFDFTAVELKQESDQVGIVQGYGSTFGNIDEGGDMIARGAFTETLADWRARGKWPKMLLQHGGGFLGGAFDMVPIGQWTHMEENRKGLKVEGRLFALNTERGQYIYESLKSGELDGLSIGYRTVKETPGTREAGFERRLDAVELWEVSIVTFPMNREALVSAVKSLTTKQIRDLEGLLGERGVSQTQAVRAIAAFKDWLAREARAPEIIQPREAVVPDDPMAEALALADCLGASMLLGALDPNVRG